MYAGIEEGGCGIMPLKVIGCVAYDRFAPCDKCACNINQHECTKFRREHNASVKYEDVE